MTKYKIESTDHIIILYRRRFWMWFVKERKEYKYSNHAISIQRKWIEKYGVGNFVK